MSGSLTVLSYGRFNRPLREAIPEAQQMLPLAGPDVDTCDDGYLLDMTVTPCAVCVDTHKACPCPAYLAWWDHTNPAPADPPECAVCVDIEWLTLAGEHPEQIAARLHFASRTGLYDHLRRHGRLDLIGRKDQQ